METKKKFEDVADENEGAEDIDEDLKSIDFRDLEVSRSLATKTKKKRGNEKSGYQAI